MAKRREKNPDCRPLSNTEIVLFAAVCQAIAEGAKNLKQYGVPELAIPIAVAGGTTRGVIETIDTIKNR